MPVKKTSSKASKHDCCMDNNCHGDFLRGLSSKEHGRRLMTTILGLLMVYALVYLGALIRNEIKEYNFIGKSPEYDRTITVSARGTSDLAPDQASTVIGVTIEAESVEEAQQENTEKTNSIIEALMALGIAKEDMQTQNYQVYPRYDYNEGSRELVGHQVSQDIKVTIRDVEMAGKVFEVAGANGANNIGSIDFSIDDSTSAQDVARADAMKNLIDRAQKTANALGVRLGKVSNYSEYVEQNSPYPTAYLAREAAGGGIGSAPSVLPGQEEVAINVTASFSIY